MAYLQGIDISQAQGQVDHQAVANSGMNFCICKATEGVKYEDPTFAENIRKIREVTGHVYFPGAYHFARPDSVGGAADGRAEAEDFCNVVQRACGDILTNFMPPALDFEKYSESDFKENIPWIEGWVDVVEHRLGRQPMIYTGRNVWKYEVGNTDRFIGYPLWQVFYSGEAAQPPSMPWPAWTLWQYSGGGNFRHHPPVPGAGIVDVDRFTGTLDDLKRLANASDQPGPGPDPGPWPPPPPTVDLYKLRGNYSVVTARVQGLLLSHRYGPSGLTGANGLPDGKSGAKTESYLRDFKRKCSLADDTIVDWETLWMLTNGA